MALIRPRGFKGQVRGVFHHGQEIDRPLKVGYIDADIPSFTNFSLAFRRRTIHFGNFACSELEADPLPKNAIAPERLGYSNSELL